MRILFLTNSDEGIYRFRKELLIQLLKDNNELFVSSLSTKYVEMIKELGCKHYLMNFERRGTNPIKDFSLLKKYLELINEVKPNIVVTYNVKSNVYGGLACQIKRVPYISTIAGLGSALEKESFLQKFVLMLYHVGLKRASAVFFQNEQNRDFMINHKVTRNDNSVLVSGSGVNLDQYKLLDYSEKDGIHFVYVGRIMKEKGIDLYLDTAKYITKKYPNTHFHVSGMYEDDYKETIEKLEKENIIKYHGNVTDMVSNVYKYVNCIVHPSFYAEGMSNVLLEALSCGKAIITTDRPGCKEIVEDGINGFVMKERSAQDLIDKVEKYLSLTEKERKQLGLNGRKKVEQKFNRKDVVNKYIEIINKYAKQ